MKTSVAWRGGCWCQRCRPTSVSRARRCLRFAWPWIAIALLGVLLALVSCDDAPDACPPAGDVGVILDCGPTQTYDGAGVPNVVCLVDNAPVGDCLLALDPELPPAYHCRPEPFCASDGGP